MAKKAIVIGAGFAGCTTACLLTREGWEVHVLEKEFEIGGGCRTLFMGGHPYTLGPRVYYGYSEKVYGWLNSFVAMRRFPFELKSYVEQDHRFYSYPIHEDDISLMPDRDLIFNELASVDREKPPDDFEGYWINRVGKRLYDKFVNEYSKKMWMIKSNTELDTFNWSAKDHPINTGSKAAYKTSIVGYPIPVDGYNQYFEKTLAGSTLYRSACIRDLDIEGRTVVLESGKTIAGDVLVSSMPIDELFCSSLGELPYAGREFIAFVLPCKQVFPGDVRFCHYTQQEPYTRITEFKKITYYESEDTLMLMEFPSKKNKLYPYMIKKYLDLRDQYQAMLPQNVYSIGRQGSYLYSTIEQTIVQAFGVFKQITGKTVDNIDGEFYQIGDIQQIKNRKKE